MDTGDEVAVYLERARIFFDELEPKVSSDIVIHTNTNRALLESLLAQGGLVVCETHDEPLGVKALTENVDLFGSDNTVFLPEGFAVEEQLFIDIFQQSTAGTFPDGLEAILESMDSPEENKDLFLALKERCIPIKFFQEITNIGSAKIANKSGTVGKGTRDKDLACGAVIMNMHAIAAGRELLDAGKMPVFLVGLLHAEQVNFQHISAMGIPKALGFTPIYFKECEGDGIQAYTEGAIAKTVKEFVTSGGIVVAQNRASGERLVLVPDSFRCEGPYKALSPDGPDASRAR